MKKIAVIGTSCRFAGAATNSDTYYQALLNKEDLVSKVPISRFNRPDVLERGYFIKGDIDRFDAEFFQLTAQEAAHMDPAHRMLLEETYHAFEDAGLTLADVRGSRSAVFVGTLSSEFLMLKAAPLLVYTPHILRGAYNGFAASRLSYAFDLRGPCMLVDTACSSSANCVYLGMQAIRNGEATMAIAAGVNIIMYPPFSNMMRVMGVLSSDGTSKPFSADADGYGRGEGIGVVILKDYDAAVRDNDSIKLVIVDAATAHDGRLKSGLTEPSSEAQAEMIDLLYAKCNIDPNDLFYVEAHGTGTLVGDPIEAKAIGKTLGAPRNSSTGPLPMGSVKGNIGHTESVSGIANLIKIIKSIQYRAVPPVLHYDLPNPNIDFAALNLHVITQPLPIPITKEKPIIVGLSSFGMGGSNTHIIASEYVEPEVHPHELQKHYPILLSGHTQQVLNESISKMKEFCEGDAKKDESLLEKLSFTLSLHKTHHKYRANFVVDSIDTLKHELQQFIQQDNKIFPVGATQIAYVCSGQGPEWFAMGRGLMETFPLYKKMIIDISDLLQPYTGWSLFDELQKKQDISCINRIEYAQSATFSLQVGLSVVLEEYFGVTPSCVIGHSVGEVAAAYISGALSLADAVKVIFSRSNLQAQAAKLHSGKMLAVGLSPLEAEVMIQNYSLESKICIAAINAPNSVTMSGEAYAIKEMDGILKSKGKYCQMLRVDAAFHSYQMDSIEEELHTLLRDICPSTPKVPLYSTVTGKLVASELLDADYWWHNVRNEVQFVSAMSKIDSSYPKNSVCWVELAPHPVLAAYINMNAQKSSILNVSCQVRNTDDYKVLLQALTRMHVVGCNINWRKFWKFADVTWLSQVSLPLYPFRGTTMWQEEEGSVIYRKADISESHPLLGRRNMPIEGKEGATWQNIIDLSSADDPASPVHYLRDHVVRGKVLFPSAGYIEMIVCAATQLGMSLDKIALENITFKNALILNGDTKLLLHTVISDSSFRIYSKQLDEQITSLNAPIAEDSFRLHVFGDIKPHDHHLTRTYDDNKKDRSYRQLYDTAKVYKHFSRRGMDYGRYFQGITSAAIGDHDIWGKIALPAICSDSKNYFVHPAVLDSAIQLCLCTLNDDHMDTHLPVSISQIVFHPEACRNWQESNDSLNVHMYYIPMRGATKTDPTDLQITLPNQEVVISLTGLRIQAIFSKMPIAYEMVTVSEAMQNTWSIDLLESKAAISLACSKVFEQIITKYPTVGRPISLVTQNIPDLLDKLERVAVAFCVDIFKAAVRQDLEANPKVTREQLEAIPVPAFSRLLSRVVEVLIHHSILQASPQHYTFSSTREAEEAKTFPNLLALKYMKQIQDIDYLIDLLQFCARSAASVFRGEKDPSDILYGQIGLPLVSQMYAASSNCTPVLEPILSSLIVAHDSKRILRVLEVGAGTGGATIHILQLLDKLYGNTLTHAVEYAFTDKNNSFLSKAASQLAEFSEVLSFKVLDIEADPLQQGFHMESYDIVIAANVFRVVKDINMSMENMRKLLAPHGLFVMMENTIKSIYNDLTLGLLPEWWTYNDTYRTSSPYITEQKWHDILSKNGFDNMKSIKDSGTKSIATFVATKRVYEPQSWIIVTPNNVNNKLVASSMSNELKKTFNQTLYCHIIEYQELFGAGDISTSNTNDIAVVLKGLLAKDVKALHVNFIYLLDFEATGVHSSTTICIPLMKTLQAISIAFPSLSLPSFFVITNGVISNKREHANLTHVPVVGFLRSYANETKMQHIKLLDLPHLSVPISSDDITTLIPLVVSDIVDSGQDETEVTWIDNVRFSPRVKKFDFLPRSADGLFDAAENQRESAVLHKSKIEVRIAYVGYNSWTTAQQSCKSAKGVPGECSGVITKLGPGINSDLKIGDEVICITQDQDLGATHVIVDESGVFKNVPHLSLEEAAGVPLVFTQALFGLVDRANINKYHTVLIHSRDATGLAALSVCQTIGAKVVATAETKERKQVLLDTFGGSIVVVDSSSPDFTASVTAATNRGVDIIFNTIGEDTQSLIPLLGKFGHLIQIQDSTSHAPAAPKANCTIHNINLSLMEYEDVIALTKRALESFQSNGYKPLATIVHNPTQPVPNVAGMLICKSGKSQGEPNATASLFNAKRGTVLITGGLGGMGLALASWFIEKGVSSNIALISRREATSVENDQIQRMKRGASNVRVFVADVADHEQIGKVIQIINSSEMAPLQGVVHSALVLKDELVRDATPENHQIVIRPRIYGAHNLHVLTKDLADPLRFFILFSSFSAVVGLPGQAHYNASNTYMDSIVQHRNQLGLPSFSFGLPPISGTGVAERNQYVQTYQARGVKSLYFRTAFNLLESLLVSTSRGHSYFTVFSNVLAIARPNSLLKELFVKTTEEKAEGFKDKASPEYIKEQLLHGIATLSGLDSEMLSMTKPLVEYGIDSLVSMDVQNLIQKKFQLKIPIPEIISATIQNLLERVTNHNSTNYKS